nr:unnamed protein product [uncultured bacterium]
MSFEVFSLLFMFLIFGVPVIIVFFLICRALWHLGSWLKRKDRYDYYSPENEQN